MPGDHLFAYGTLRRGSTNRFARLLLERAQFVTSARAPGRLYDFGRFPGAVHSDQSDYWVHGEVHRLKDAQLLPLLDEYEGSEFGREIAPVETNDGGSIDCWIYWYVGPLTGRLIASGDWLKR